MGYQMRYITSIILITFLVSRTYCLASDGQHAFSGNLHYYSINSLIDNEIINLPYRLVELEYTHQGGDFQVTGNLALEHRLRESTDYLVSTDPQDFTLDLRELTLSWYPSFGEMRMGKQISAWGAVDENSPMDNVNAYDYYYLFFSGSDRKLGAFSSAVDIYLGDWLLGATFSPVHNTNRLPIKDEEFPIDLPVVPVPYQVLEVDRPWEGGGFLRRTFNWGDLLVSYFSGRDRLYNLSGANVQMNDFGIALTRPDTVFSYRSTEMLGLGGIFLLGDVTLRAEGVRFFSRDENDSTAISRPHPTFTQYTDILHTHAFQERAIYYQYNLQLEFELPGDIEVSTQIFRYILEDYNAEPVPDVDIPNFEVSFKSKEYFYPGMGAPIAIMSDRLWLFDISRKFADERLELSLQSVLDLKDVGQLWELSAEYEINESCSVTGALLKVWGDTERDDEYVFNQLENFSHFRLELQYYF